MPDRQQQQQQAMALTEVLKKQVEEFPVDLQSGMVCEILATHLTHFSGADRFAALYRVTRIAADAAALHDEITNSTVN